jgi:hypothetical protein
MRYALLLARALSLAGCADGPFAAIELGPHPAPEPLPTPVAGAPPKPAVEKVWSKPGASNEEFARTKARCLLQADIDSPHFAYKAVLCMRPEGWTLGPRRDVRPANQPDTCWCRKGLRRLRAMSRLLAMPSLNRLGAADALVVLHRINGVQPKLLNLISRP